jgi:anti-anti-sigma regulatory factor
MNFSVESVQVKVPVTILAPDGDVDGSNYRLLIAKAQELHAAGTQYLLLDLQHVNYMSSAGLVALHSIGKSLAGEAPPDPDSGWDAYHAVQRDRPAGTHSQLKLLNPQPRVEKLLEMAGMNAVFEVYRDQAKALASF